ncbi:TPA: hypothetical protein L7053_005043 [Klebsiella pneumoniae]|nr:hypothetical protein [Klebsiella pneumoniae]HBQ4074042.1 hypothetical protein [Klebsiella pneumoniae]HBV6346039.1 hypothetical protein [Klebsiella pneumoniae]HCA9762653.1 hypothetical protein [Klebsiella pneumoniae]HCB0174871.1 hypothetical protein [Klebsiella pneumoniae]
METMTLSRSRDLFAYHIGMLIIVMNEIDMMMVTAYQTIFDSQERASKTFVKKEMAGKIKSVLAFVKDKDECRMRLGEILQELVPMLSVRNALAHGGIGLGGDTPSGLTLIALGHELTFTPESLREYVIKAIDLSQSVSISIAMITFFDLKKNKNG